ncbi:hypothetical protein KU710_23775, partial [Salmonella enterica subsp. enterica serovar Give]|nr:hypothetical protein [Salmonella enterica subsp. enterica serovar Give]
QQLLSSPHSLFPVCRGELDEIIGIVRAKELLVALEEGADVAARNLVKHLDNDRETNCRVQVAFRNMETKPFRHQAQADHQQ